jgi:hypothetical protein
MYPGDSQLVFERKGLPPEYLSLHSSRYRPFGKEKPVRTILDRALYFS